MRYKMHEFKLGDKVRCLTNYWEHTNPGDILIVVEDCGHPDYVTYDGKVDLKAVNKHKWDFELVEEAQPEMKPGTYIIRILFTENTYTYLENICIQGAKLTYYKDKAHKFDEKSLTEFIEAFRIDRTKIEIIQVGE